MRLNENGLALLRSFEGFRAEAYKDSAGVWTIGYGHTGRAGPPSVHAHSRMGEPEARALLALEAEAFAAMLRRHLRRELSDDQFSALVCFAYNVGEANLAKSSVLKAANAGDDAAVARRLGLWVKAGGKPMAGLVRRRAAEAALYLSASAAADRARKPDVPQGKPLRQSTTGLAAGISATAGTAAATAASVRQVADSLASPWAMALCVGVMLAAFIWILLERHRKSREEGV